MSNKCYVVGIISLFDNDLKQFQIYDESEYDALKQAMLLRCNNNRLRSAEAKFQNSPEYPKNFKNLEDLLLSLDVISSVVEVGSFLTEL